MASLSVDKELRHGHPSISGGLSTANVGVADIDQNLSWNPEDRRIGMSYEALPTIWDVLSSLVGDKIMEYFKALSSIRKRLIANQGS